MKKKDRNQPMLLPRQPEPKILDDTVLDALSAEDIYTPEECRGIINHFEQREWMTASVTGSATDDSGRIATEFRDSRVQFLDPKTDQFAVGVLDKLLQIIIGANGKYQFEMDYFQAAQIARYDVGHHYDWHFDIGPGYLGNRKMSLSVQLSSPDDYDGGDLILRMNQDEVMPRSQGTAVAFPSFVQHKVTPITRGTRYSLVAWSAGNTRFR